MKTSALNRPKNNSFHSRVLDFVPVLFSAFLLVLAFPKTDYWLLAWVGLVPLLVALERRNYEKAFRSSYLTGVLFFWGMLYWFVHVTGIGATLLIFYLALYFALFGWALRFFSPLKFKYRVIILPSLWVVLEYVRASLFTGFGWVSLGHSQYKNLLFIQIADLTGVAGISFILVMANLIVKEGIILRWQKKTGLSKEYKKVVLFFVILVSIVLVYGQYHLTLEEKTKVQQSSDNQITVALVQANTAQEDKWQESKWPMIMEEYLELTSSVAQQKPDLIIWPETSFPGYLWKDIAYFVRLRDFVDEMNVALLFGSVTHEGDDYYNSTLLLNEDGEVAGQYNKLHLVPFGEYLPFRKWLPFLKEIVPIDDFSSGVEFQQYAMGRKSKNTFSTLICFEDTVSYLARGFVLRGSRLLINVTNDAWFKDTKAPYLHLQASVFRSVENRRFLVRAANTGVSAVIDAAGRIVSEIKDESGKSTYVKGSTTAVVQFRKKITPYTKLGDVFTYACIFCILWGVGMRLGKKKLD